MVGITQNAVIFTISIKLCTLNAFKKINVTLHLTLFYLPLRTTYGEPDIKFPNSIYKREHCASPPFHFKCIQYGTVLSTVILKTIFVINIDYLHKNKYK